MKQNVQAYPDPDDMFADTRMSFGEHIEDLRSHLLRAIYGFLIGFAIAIPIGPFVLDFIAAPVKIQLKEFNDRYLNRRTMALHKELQEGGEDVLPPITVKMSINIDELAERLGLRREAPPKGPVLDKMMSAVEELLAALKMDHVVDWRKTDEGHFMELRGRISNPIDYVSAMHRADKTLTPQLLTTLSVQEAFMVLFKVIMITGLVIASPWVFYQIWAFIAAGLYPAEKRLVNVYLPVSVVLFIVGVFTCEFFVIPKAIEAMLWFNELLGFQPDLRLSEWLGFAIFTPVVFGISFQTPLIMYFLEMIGLFTVETYRSTRRIAWFVLAVFAAIITPTVDALSMMFLWVPMCILYELGIWMCRFSSRSATKEWETPDSDENIEV